MAVRGGLLLAVLAVAPVRATAATTNVFSYTGADQTFTVPAGVTTVAVARECERSRGACKHPEMRGFRSSEPDRNLLMGGLYMT